MAYLINRNPSGRLICLHALSGYLANRFSTKKFKLNDLKYDAESAYNIHQTCKLLIKLPAVNYSVCPYLDNPLSQAKCYLTQSLQEDKQKSKSASDAFNALEGLGLINRDGKLGYLTSNGLEFVKNDYFHPDTLKLIQKAVMSYGPFWALLFLCNQNKDQNGIISREQVRIGYPETLETLVKNGRNISLSTGSQDDTVTRTRSLLFTWGVTAGFLLPTNFQKPKEPLNWHVALLPFITRDKWTAHSYKVFIGNSLFDGKPYVSRPLGYNAMTKSTKALRERYQEDQRGATLEFEGIIKNRRFGISYLLALASEQGCGLVFDDLVKEMVLYEGLFVIDKQTFLEVMRSELAIAFATGIPFYENKRVLFPLTRVNIGELMLGAPKEVINTVQEISKKTMSK